MDITDLSDRNPLLYPDPDRVPDPREVLDPGKKAMVLALLVAGFSRRAAAKRVGVSHTTIARAATRDKLFATQLLDAEWRTDYEALKLVRSAAREEKYWRAAAWLLERRLPDDFGHRTAHSFSGDQVMALLAEVFSYTLPALAEDRREQFIRSFNATLGEVEQSVKNADRWRHMAEAEAENREDTGLRSPYEHPEWNDPESGEGTGATGEAPAEEAEVGGEKGDGRGEIVGVEEIRKQKPLGGARGVQRAPGGANGARDVCQSSQRWGKRQKKLRRRNLLAANTLQQADGCVPEAAKRKGGEHNGHCGAHTGNGSA
jgi:hypothetical protein